MKRNFTMRSLITAMSLMSGAVCANAGIVQVANSTNNAVGSLRLAILAANAGDTITFNSATNGLPITLTTGELVINKSLVIMGNNTTNTVISGGVNSRIFNISNAGAVAIIGVKLTGGSTLLNGGAMDISNSTVQVTACEISNNTALGNGGAINNAGSLYINNSIVTENTALGTASSNGGGAIFNNGGTLVIENGTTLSHNMATGLSGSGGAIFSSSGAVTVSNSVIDSNAANRAGGAIEMINGSVMINGSLLSNNNVAGSAGLPSPGNGGAVHVSGSSATMILDSTLVVGNIAATEGGGLWNQSGSTLSLNNSAVQANVALGASANDGGGGIFNNGGTVNINGSLVNGNMAVGASGSGGGIFSVSGTVTVHNSLLDSNSANRAGGAIELIDGTLSVAGCIMSYNDVNGTAGTANPGNGGAIHVTGMSGTTVNIDSCLIINNMAAAEGGALWNQSGSTLNIQNAELHANVAMGASSNDGGGAVFNNGGTLNLTNTMLAHNMATGASGSGGAIFSTDGVITINDCYLDSNAANRAGGAIEIVDGTLTVNASTMIANNVNGTAGTANPGNGGALHVTGNAGTMVTIDGSTIANNSAALEGGALWNQSGSTLVVQGRTTIDANIAAGAGTDDGGGGIFNNGGVVNVSTATISNNSASGSAGTGGGLFNYNNGKVTITHSTVSGNTASAGAGIHNNGVMTITANTITKNTAATDGGGIAQMNTTDTVTITSTIVAGNTVTAGAGADIFSSSTTAMSGGYNLVGKDDANDFPALSTDIEGTATNAISADLNPLADNGSGIKTHSLMSTSMAIDKGNPADNSNDQRDSMVYNGKRDIGAYESKFFPQSVSKVLASVKGSIVPNPSVDGMVEVSIPAGMSVTSVKVIEMSTGKTVYDEPVSGSKKLNLGAQASGTYLVQIAGVEGIESHKLVIAR